jgi:hypothetical protein
MDATKSSTTTWRDRIVGQGEAPPADLKAAAHPLNWRLHSASQRTALAGILDEVGWVQRVILNRTTGHLLDGHLRVDLALERHEESVPVLYVELSEEEERLVLATLDPISTLAEVGREALDQLLDSLPEHSAALDDLLADLRTRAGHVEPEDFADLDQQLQTFAGMGDETITLVVPEKHAPAVREWLSNGEDGSTQAGLGRGVLKRCGLL